MSIPKDPIDPHNGKTSRQRLYAFAHRRLELASWVASACRALSFGLDSGAPLKGSTRASFNRPLLIGLLLIGLVLIGAVLIGALLIVRLLIGPVLIGPLLIGCVLKVAVLIGALLIELVLIGPVIIGPL